MPQVPTDGREGSGRYQFRVKGHLTRRWTDWFDGFAITPAGDGTTVVEGHVVDQAALHGVLRKLGDLGLPLVSVTPINTNPADYPADHH
jgi:hypothetical protein